MALLQQEDLKIPIDGAKIIKTRAHCARFFYDNLFFMFLI
jgi:hypothetical protein